MKFKYFGIAGLVIIWELLIWMIYNGHLLRPRVWVLFDEKTIYESFYLGGAFFNAGTFTFVLVLTVIFIAIYCEKLETNEALVRHTSRATFFIGREERFLLIGTIYSLVHFVIGFALSVLIFQDEYVQNIQTYKFYIFSLIILDMYFVRISTAYMILRDIMKKRIKAVFCVMAICSIEVLASSVIWDNAWFPCKDLSAGALVYLEKMSSIEIALTLIRQIGLTIILFLIGMKVFERRDVLDLEE